LDFQSGWIDPIVHVHLGVRDKMNCCAHEWKEENWKMTCGDMELREERREERRDSSSTQQQKCGAKNS